MWLKRIIMICVMMLLSQETWAQTTNLKEEVNAALANYGPVPVTVLKQIPHTQTVCGPPMPRGPDHIPYQHCVQQTYYTSQSNTEKKPLVASNITILNVEPLSWGTIIATQLPDEVYADSAWGQACENSPGPLTAGYNLTVSVSRTATIQLSKSVTHTQSQSVNFGVSAFKIFRIGGQLSFGEQVTEGRVDIDSNQKTVTYSHSDNWSVPPGKAAVVQLKAWAIRYTIPFTTTVTIDADLSANDLGFKHLSDVLKEPAKRTFSIAGTIETTDASEAHYVEYGAPYDPSQCSQLDLRPVKPGFAPPKTLHLLEEKPQTQ